MFAWLVIIVVIKQILGAPVALLGLVASQVVAAFRHTRLLSLWISVLFTLLGWSLTVSYSSAPFFQLGTRRPSTLYAIEPVRPLQSRQIVLSCCCPGVTATDDAADDEFMRRLAFARAFNERLTARRDIYLLSRKELTLTMSSAGRRLHLSEAYDAYCNRCAEQTAAFPDDPGSLLVTLIHGSVRLPPRERP